MRVDIDNFIVIFINLLYSLFASLLQVDVECYMMKRGSRSDEMVQNVDAMGLGAAPHYDRVQARSKSG